MSISVKLKRSYRSAKGNTVFVYDVKANEVEAKQFEEAQGEFHRTDETTGAPLWFTTRCIGDKGTLIITSKGKVVPDMSAFEQAASIAKQFGGNFGQELAKQSVANLLGGKPSDETAEAGE